MADEEIIETATGLGYVDLVEGTGPRPKTGESVRVHYTGWLKSGQKFDSSHDRGQPLVFPVGRGRVIRTACGQRAIDERAAWPATSHHPDCVEAVKRITAEAAAAPRSS